MNWLRHHVINIKKFDVFMLIGNFPYVAHTSFFKEIGGLLAGSSQSKQIALFLQLRQAKTSRRIVLSIWKLHLYFVYFKVYVTMRGNRKSLSNNNALREK